MPAGQKPVCERVVGRYSLYGELAAGGMATVHLGRMLGPVGFSKTVAVKRLHPHFAKDPEFSSMFLDEARLAARIQHPNVVGTLDVVSMEGELFLVMDYIHGETLSKIAKELRGRGEMIPPRVAAGIICGALYGLHAAHEAKSERGRPLGIIHRDVSPQNIMIGLDGVARVLDFGVAKAAGRAQGTRDGQLKGKLAYMPPEQLRGSAMDRRTDVYGASVVLWELLTGRKLYFAEHEAVLFAKVLEGVVEAPSQVQPSVPPELDAVVLKGLAADPEARYSSAKEMAMAIEDIIPLASPGQIASWVESVVGKSLEERAERVKEIETMTSGLFSVPPPPPPESNPRQSRVSAVHSQVFGPPPAAEDPDDSALTQESLDSLLPPSAQTGSLSKVSKFSRTGTQDDEPTSKKRIALTTAGLTVFVAVAAGIFWWVQSTHREQAVQSAPAQPAPTLTSTAPAPLVPVATAAPAVQPAAAIASSAPDAPLVDLDLEAPKMGSSKEHRPKGAGTSAATSTPTAKPAAVNCNPPFVIGADGLKRVKPGCN